MAPADGDASQNTQLAEACLGLDRRFPHFSARRVLTWLQGSVAGGAVALGVFAAAHAPGAAAVSAHVAFWAVFMALTLVRLFAAGATLVKPKTDASNAWRDAEPRYTILCPLYREEGGVPSLAAALDRLDYPRDKLEIVFIAEGDDAATIAALSALPPAPHRRVTLVPPASPRTKPKALNFALAQASGEFVAVYDAEDVPDPAQLRAALDAFAAGGERLAAVQSPLSIDNGGASWIASQFAAEYAIQFRGILPALASLGAPLPLGGAGNHFRRSALDDAGGWDPWNVTEDADLAYRLARRGWRLGVIAPPTFEEGPARIGAWLRQRTRWIKGHVQTWLVLMRNPARTAKELGLKGFLWMQLILGGGLIASFAHAPLLAMVMASLATPDLAPFGAADWALLLTGYVSAMVAALFAALVERNGRLALSALTMPLYWPLATLAALWAACELFVRPHYWAKTEHGLTPRHALRDNAAHDR